MTTTQARETSFVVGNGGWLYVDDAGLPGPLYLRLAADRGRYYPTEIYLDGRGREIQAAHLRLLQARVPAWIAGVTRSGREREAVESSRGVPFADLSRLASYFATFFAGSVGHWVAESFHAQADPANVQQPPVLARPRRLHRADAREPTVPAPAGRLDRPFLEDVAAYYHWCLATGRRPAPTLAERTGHSARTVHSWIYQARKRGVLPPARQGKAG